MPMALTHSIGWRHGSVILTCRTDRIQLRSPLNPAGAAARFWSFYYVTNRPWLMEMTYWPNMRRGSRCCWTP